MSSVKHIFFLRFSCVSWLIMRETEKKTMDSDWPFADSQDAVVVTLERILRGDSSLLLVTHDAEDGGWQFLDGEQVFEEDGTTVLLGEMVQFDPSLLELADLPAGWFAWRPRAINPGSEHRVSPEARRIPFSDRFGKAARETSRSRPALLIRIVFARRLEAMSDTAVEILNQRDIFFAAATGRLKLRILDDCRGELIHYDRPDLAGPKLSSYLIAPTSAPEVLLTILSQVLNIVGTVRKRRRLYRVGQTRVHLDRVEYLGDFVELEVVLDPGQAEAEGTAIAEDLMRRFAIRASSLCRKPISICWSISGENLSSSAAGDRLSRSME